MACAFTRSGEIVVGISAFAIDQLGDITVVNIDVKQGDRVEAKKAFGTVESVKTLSDLYCPLSGTAGCHPVARAPAVSTSSDAAWLLPGARRVRIHPTKVRTRNG